MIRDVDIKINEIMTRDVVVVKENDSIEDLFNLFEKYNFHTYPVVNDNGELIGTIDETIILDILLFHRTPRTGHTHLAAMRSVGETARDLISHSPVTISPGNSLNDAADLMLKHNLDDICIVENGRLTGILSISDVIKEVIKRKRFE